MEKNPRMLQSGPPPFEPVNEPERTRIAREIHDDLGGNLAAIKMALALLTRRLPPENPILSEKAAYVDALVDRTIDAMHRIIDDLRPGVLDLGLVAALEWQVREFGKQLGVPCEFLADAREPALDPDQVIGLFRIVQEALTNIGKHAGASRVQVRLAASANNLRLEVADNGRGIGPSERARLASHGIRGMRERAHALGATLALTQAPGGGTVVAISLPLPGGGAA
jgi:two-component system sensor histidine kinase UhpB